MEVVWLIAAYSEMELRLAEHIYGYESRLLNNLSIIMLGIRLGFRLCLLATVSSPPNAPGVYHRGVTVSADCAY